MKIDADRWARLQSRLETFDDQAAFLTLETETEKYARAPGEATPFLVPYLPFVGPRYERGGILIYAVAQNATGGDVAAWWPSCIGHGQDAVRRLYHDASREMDARFERGPFDPFRFARSHVPIQPITDGPLLALSGLLEHALQASTSSDLDEVLGRIACGNYFKFALVQRDRNVDPSRLSSERLERYSRLMAEHFILPELEVIEPAFIIALGSAGPGVLEKTARSAGVHRVFRVNDPSWILRGMSGLGGVDGKWARYVQNYGVPEEVEQLIDGYLDQFGSRYRGGKRADTATYLKKYWIEFTDAVHR